MKYKNFIKKEAYAQLFPIQKFSEHLFIEHIWTATSGVIRFHKVSKLKTQRSITWDFMYSGGAIVN